MKKLLNKIINLIHLILNFTSKLIIKKTYTIKQYGYFDLVMDKQNVIAIKCEGMYYLTGQTLPENIIKKIDFDQYPMLKGKFNQN